MTIPSSILAALARAHVSWHAILTGGLQAVQAADPAYLADLAAAPVGPGGSDLAVGDAVVLIFRPNCGACLSCATGRPALCEPGGEANGAKVRIKIERVA